jgi:predicted TIM-barrel fold metal-dependent hydrolase
MFGSDQMYWPEAIGLAVDGVDSATFLTPAEKRDILYGNAVRFLRLEQDGALKMRPALFDAAPRSIETM